VTQEDVRLEQVDWDFMELEAFNLRYDRMSYRERLRKARTLANTFIKHNKPLPHGLVVLGQSFNRAESREPAEEKRSPRAAQRAA
jgi:hypothetical protein